MAKRAAVLYARISVSSEESVSVRRQIASGRKYAAARGPAGGAWWASTSMTACRRRATGRRIAPAGAA